MHARKQAILTRSDPIPSLRPGIDTSKRKKWQRSISRQPAQQPASQPQRSRNAHHLDIAAPGAFPRSPPGSTTRPQGPPHARAAWQMPGTRRSGVKKMPPNLASGLKRNTLLPLASTSILVYWYRSTGSRLRDHDRASWDLSTAILLPRLTHASARAYTLSVR